MKLPNLMISALLALPLAAAAQTTPTPNSGKPPGSTTNPGGTAPGTATYNNTTPRTTATPGGSQNVVNGQTNGANDGIVFYNGKPYIIRNGLASLIDPRLVPNGQVLTHDGRLMPLPPNFTNYSDGTTQIIQVVPVTPPTPSVNTTTTTIQRTETNSGTTTPAPAR